MKRQKGYNGLENEDDYFPMQNVQQKKFANLLEAQVQNGDTLQALALKFHCTVTEIKRLNKIDKDNEIFARKTIKVPITPHSILLETLPIVHKSGQSSPRHRENGSESKNPFLDSKLDEKLLVASVNSSGSHFDSNNSINNIILNSTVRREEYPNNHRDGYSKTDPLLSGELDETIPQPVPIRGPAESIFDCSGSDCDISWICLFICILALCFAIPLVYVFYVAEHLERFHHSAR